MTTTCVPDLQKIMVVKEKTLTLREIDVIACLLSGQNFKFLSSFIGVEERTFRTHWSNVKKKLVFFSKEALIRYFEETQLNIPYRLHYTFLKKEEAFRKCVKKIKTAYKVELHYPLFPHMRLFAELIKRHCDYVGIDLKIVLNSNLEDNTFLFIDKSTSFQKIINLNNIFNQNTDYFLWYIDFLKDLNMEILFDRGYYESLTQHMKNEEKNIKNTNMTSFLSKINLRLFFIFLVILGSLFYMHNMQDGVFIKVDEPFLAHLLPRHTFQQEMEKRLQGSNKISYCALLGVKGSGKTTLAHIYARSQKVKISFEIDSKSNESIENSFFTLAFLLSQKTEEKELVDFIKRIQDTTIRQRQLIDFVQKKIKENGDWILIFDNILSCEEIDEFIPKDVSLWGKGQVILTSFNRNVMNYIGESSCIIIDELTQKEISDIVHTVDQKVTNDELDVFCNEFPKYVLDITLAVNHMRTKKINFQQQDTIKRLVANERKKFFNSIFSSFLDIDGRYKDLFFVLSIIDYRKIPRSFFYHLFDNDLVDCFIYDLKSTGLITYEKMEGENYYFSIHPFIRELSNIFLHDRMSKKEMNKLLKEKLHIFFNKIISWKIPIELYEDLTTHMERFNTFLLNSFECDKELSVLSNIVLAYCHYFGTRRLDQALFFFERALQLNQLDSKRAVLSRKEKLDIRFFISVLYTDMGLGDLALKTISKGLQECTADDQFKKAEFLSQKGYALSLFDRFDASEESCQESLEILKMLPENEKIKNLISTIKGQQAVLYATTFLNKDVIKPVELIEEALKDVGFVGQLHKGLPRFVCYHFSTLGFIYCQLGQHEKAIEALEKAFYIMDNKLDGLSHYIIRLFAMASYGECLFFKGDFKQAKNILKECVLKTYQLRGKQFYPVYRVQTFLMATYLKLGLFEEAEIELENLIKFDVTGAPPSILFTQCLLYYYGADLFLQNGSFMIAEYYFRKFFQEIQLFLKKFNGKTSVDDPCDFLKVSKNKAKDFYILKNKAKDYLNSVYPKVNF